MNPHHSPREVLLPPKTHEESESQRREATSSVSLLLAASKVDFGSLMGPWKHLGSAYPSSAICLDWLAQKMALLSRRQKLMSLSAPPWVFASFPRDRGWELRLSSPCENDLFYSLVGPVHVSTRIWSVAQSPSPPWRGSHPRQACFPRTGDLKSFGVFFSSFNPHPRIHLLILEREEVAEREGERERENTDVREKRQLVISLTGNRTLNPFVHGQCSNQLSHPARARHLFGCRLFLSAY